MSKIKPIRVAYAESKAANQKQENFKFWAPFNERTLIGRNPVGISKKKGKEWIKQKIIKFSALDCPKTSTCKQLSDKPTISSASLPKVAAVRTKSVV